MAKQQTISRNQQQATSQTTALPEELSPIPRGPFKHSFEVETKYDKFRDQTKVSLDCKVYYKGPFALFLAVEGSYPKQSPSLPETVQLGLTAMSAKEKYKKSRRLIVLADGQRFDLGELGKDVEEVEEILIFEKMMTTVPFRTVLQMANSQSVEMQLNEIEFKVPSEALEALRDFTSRFRHQ
ncbi:MAG TPA: hypothetical protein DC047_06435 [Blastocatellia bacterium]|nr:hypothetical protein [Blastocatellia bacterium]